MGLIRTVSASQAKEYYYDKDPIFASEGMGENSEWFGNLKEAFPWFSDHVVAENFEALLFGLDPADADNKKALIKEGVNKNRRAGIDFAFSAPKSVSIMALHCKDDRIVDAHKDAVKKALSFVQDNFIYYRDKIDKKLVQIQSDNMIAAQFTHGTSRANDPQLHTHAVVINMTKTPDGRFKAISNEHIFKYQSLINNIYQNELAINVQGLGYVIDNYENKFEIKGVSEDAIETFSKRSREIDDMVEKLRKEYPDLTEAELMDRATLKSRNNKDAYITAEELYAKWEAEYSRDNINPVPNYIKEPVEKDMASEAIDLLHQTEATFNRYQLLNSLVMQNRGLKSLKEFRDLIQESLRDNKAIKIGEKDTNEIYASPEMIRCEQDIINTAIQGKDTLKALLDKDNILPYLPENLTGGQRELVNFTLTSKDRIGVIQGDAGTGKTYAVKVLKDILAVERPTVEIVGLGFTGKAAQELSDAAGIKTSTISSFLLSDKQKDEKTENQLILVDEASMVSSKDMLGLIQKAENSRIVFIGDGKQLQAIGAGKMFKELQKGNVVKVVKMEEVLRQTTEHTKAIVRYIKNYQEKNDETGIDTAISILESKECISEAASVSKNEEVTFMYLREKAVEEYLKNDDCLLLTPSRLEKDTLNKMTRAKYLSKEEIIFSKKIKVRESIPTKSYLASEYKEGDIIILKGKEGKVTEVDKDKNLIHISALNKRTNKVETITINPYQTSFAAYRESEKDFSPNDKIMFSRNDKKLDVQNGLSGIIKGIDEHGNVSVMLKKDREVIFNLNNYSYLDYGYAQTVHKAQGQTSKTAILVHNHTNKINTEGFYVAATRAKEDFKIITDNKSDFIKAVKREQDKSSTLDFVEPTDKLPMKSSEIKK